MQAQYFVAFFQTRYASLAEVSEEAPADLAAHIARSRRWHEDGRLLMREPSWIGRRSRSVRWLYSPPVRMRRTMWRAIRSCQRHGRRQRDPAVGKHAGLVTRSAAHPAFAWIAFSRTARSSARCPASAGNRDGHRRPAPAGRTPGTAEREPIAACSRISRDTDLVCARSAQDLPWFTYRTAAAEAS